MRGVEPGVSGVGLQCDFFHFPGVLVNIESRSRRPGCSSTSRRVFPSRLVGPAPHGHGEFVLRRVQQLSSISCEGERCDEKELGLGTKRGGDVAKPGTSSCCDGDSHRKVRHEPRARDFRHVPRASGGVSGPLSNENTESSGFQGVQPLVLGWVCRSGLRRLTQSMAEVGKNWLPVTHRGLVSRGQGWCAPQDAELQRLTRCQQGGVRLIESPCGSDGGAAPKRHERALHSRRGNRSSEEANYHSGVPARPSTFEVSKKK